ncbi:hypothetical protein [Embleya sp. NBC_00896]|nr:hypothetical protein OG928_42965 [Embleya sp. NBC_00896]
MAGREDDLAYQAIVRAFLDGDPQNHQGVLSMSAPDARGRLRA